MKKSIAVLLIEDNRLLRDGIAAMLNRQPDLKVLAAAAEPNETLLRSPRLKPQVVLLDLGLQNHDSLRFAETVKRELPEAKVIVMGLPPLQEDLMEFVRAGAAGFIMKDATSEDFVRTIRSVVDGANVLPPPLTRPLFSQIANQATRHGCLQSPGGLRLTQRERDVINLVAEGLSNKEIAERLTIATHTVKSHVHNILEKLALHTRLEIAAYAHRGGAHPPSKN